MEQTKCHGNSAVTWPTETPSHESINCQKKRVKRILSFEFSKSVFPLVGYYANTAVGKVMRRIIMD